MHTPEEQNDTKKNVCLKNCLSSIQNGEQKMKFSGERKNEKNKHYFHLNTNPIVIFTSKWYIIVLWIIPSYKSSNIQ